MTKIGTRPSRTLPYEFQYDDSVDNSSIITITLTAVQNGAAFYAYDLLQPLNPPRKYGLAAGSEISDTYECVEKSGNAYDVVIHGPNGFIRSPASLLFVPN